MVKKSTAKLVRKPVRPLARERKPASKPVRASTVNKANKARPSGGGKALAGLLGLAAGGVGGFVAADHAARRRNTRSAEQVQDGLNVIRKQIQQVDDRMADIGQVPLRTLEDTFAELQAESLKTMLPAQALDGMPNFTKEDILNRIRNLVGMIELLATGAGTTKIGVLRAGVRHLASTEPNGKYVFTILSAITRFHVGKGVQVISHVMGAFKVISALDLVTRQMGPKHYARQANKVQSVLDVLRIDKNCVLSMVGDLAGFAQVVSSLLTPEPPTGDVPLYFIVDIFRRLSEYTLQLLYGCMIFVIASGVNTEQAEELYPEFDFYAICDPTRRVPHPIIQVLRLVDVALIADVRNTSTNARTGNGTARTANRPKSVFFEGATYRHWTSQLKNKNAKISTRLAGQKSDPAYFAYTRNTVTPLPAPLRASSIKLNSMMREPVKTASWLTALRKVKLGPNRSPSAKHNFEKHTER